MTILVIALVSYFLISFVFYKIVKRKAFYEGERDGYFKGYDIGVKDGYEEAKKHKQLGYVENKQKQGLEKNGIDYLIKKDE